VVLILKKMCIWAYHLCKSQDQKCSPSHCIWAKCNNRMSYLCVFAYCPCSCRHLMSSACSRLCRFVHMDCFNTTFRYTLFSKHIPSGESLPPF